MECAHHYNVVGQECPTYKITNPLLCLIAKKIFYVRLLGMQISSYMYKSLNYNPTFRNSNDKWNVFGIDSATEDTRKELRKHYEEEIMPYALLYDKDTPSVIEYMFIHYPNRVNISQPKKLEDFKNSYKGLSLVNRKEALEELKSRGIKTVIDLVAQGSDYRYLVQESGMDFKSCNLSFGISVDRAECLDDFADVIAAMKKDNFYIGCTLGTNVTRQFLNVADYFIHPDKIKKVSDLSTLSFVEGILEYMTPEQKERMTLSEDDEQAIKGRIKYELENYI